jgi:hypothetical protein
MKYLLIVTLCVLFAGCAGETSTSRSVQYSSQPLSNPPSSSSLNPSSSSRPPIASSSRPLSSSSITIRPSSSSLKSSSSASTHSSANNNAQNIDPRIFKAFKDVYGIEPTHVLVDNINSTYGSSPGSTVCCFNFSGNLQRAIIIDYTQKAVLMIFLNLDNGDIRWRKNEMTLPRDEVETLTLILDNGLTDLTSKLPAWEQAIAVINDGWAQHFKSIGFAEAPAKLVNTNVVVKPSEFGNTGTNNLGAFFMAKGYDTARYDQFILIDLDPSNPDGGAQSGNSIEVNYFFSKVEGFVQLSNSQITSIARTTFVHELGHGFGWDHDWPRSNNIPSIEPSLEYYGWVDVDGDGVIEMLDPTPWGIGTKTTR